MGTGSVQRETYSQSQSVFIQSGFVFVYGRDSAFTLYWVINASMDKT